MILSYLRQIKSLESPTVLYHSFKNKALHNFLLQYFTVLLLKIYKYQFNDKHKVSNSLEGVFL